MAESIQLSTLAESPTEANDLNDYESVRVSRFTDNEYVELKNVSERARVQADPVYANTTLVRCSMDSTDADACISSSNAITSQSVTAENRDIAAIHRALAETSSSLKRVQITCIVLGIALVACSATLGALVLTMREKLHQSEQVSDNMQVSIGKLQAQTGTAVSTNTTLQEHAVQLEKMLNENSALINNHNVRIEAMEQASVENIQFIQENIDSQLEQSKAVIRDHTTRIELLEEASTDSTILIKNHTNVLLELDGRYNTTKGVIEAHSTALANLTQSIVDNNILIQNHTAKLSEIESVQVIKTAKIVELDKAIVDINIALLNYSYKFSEMVHGSWGSWASWTTCSSTCGIGVTHRSRACDSPRPSLLGNNCFGDSSEYSLCSVTPCPVNGHWTDWTMWSGCSVTCGSGKKTRQRYCSNPAPSNGGSACLDSSTDQASCNSTTCPVNGQWSSWTSWSTCTSLTCSDPGLSQRNRPCSRPAPSYGGRECIGDASSQKICYKPNCDGQVRLIGGNRYGRVEVLYQGLWGTICDDAWDNNDAKVICRMLGYSGGTAYTDAHYGQGSGRITLDNVHCNGSESSITSCRHSSWLNHNCNHREDAGVTCS